MPHFINLYVYNMAYLISSHIDLFRLAMSAQSCRGRRSAEAGNRARRVVMGIGRKICRDETVLLALRPEPVEDGLVIRNDHMTGCRCSCPGPVLKASVHIPICVFNVRSVRLAKTIKKYIPIIK